MIKVFLFGISGKMGQSIIEYVSKTKTFEITGGFDIVPNAVYPTFNDVEKVNVPFDVIIDFSRPETLPMVKALALKTSCPVVLSTTGYSESEIKQIEELSHQIPVFYSGNMSLGINVLIDLAAKATKVLFEDFDVEIIEKHHNQKVDAPSGTALMIAEAINSAADKKASFVYGREGKKTLRKKNDIGIHALRGGTVVGEHEVLFLGNDEIITITHSASSRKVFVVGSLRAAQFLIGKKNGKYNMKDMLNE